MEGEEGRKTGLSDKLAKKVASELFEMQTKKGKSKEKKFMKIKLSKSQLKKGFVNTIILKRNGGIDLKKNKIEDGAIYLTENKTYHMSEAHHIWYYKNYPVMLIPEWTVEPINRSQWSEKTLKEGTNVDAQKFIIKKSEEFAAGMKPSKSFGNPMIWLIVIGAIVLIYVISLIAGKPII